MWHDEFNVEQLRNTRCRLQRHGDLKFFSGWIRTINHQQMLVELNEDENAKAGDRFYVEAAFSEAIVCLTADTILADVANTSLAIADCQVCSRPGQMPRYQAEGIEVDIYGLESKLEGTAIDISGTGIGLLTYAQVPRFVPVKLIVRGPTARVHCEGRVRYCRRDASDKELFRVGIQLEPMEAAEERMWNRLVGAAAELCEAA